MSDMTDATPTIAEMVAAVQFVADNFGDIRAVFPDIDVVLDKDALRTAAAALSSLSPLIAAAQEALTDAVAGLRYVRQHYHDERTANGDLYGVEFDRVEGKAKAALEALSTFPAPASLWRPIETAPRDGTEILLYERISDLGHDMRSAFWGRHNSRWIFNPGINMNAPSHWHPLPALPPPATEQSR